MSIKDSVGTLETEMFMNVGSINYDEQELEEIVMALDRFSKRIKLVLSNRR